MVTRRRRTIAGFRRSRDILQCASVYPDPEWENQPATSVQSFKHNDRRAVGADGY